ncbi:hypoxanthine phosphoribosyltransferase [candidate division KSB1 bacterium]|nr:hypoxanthine phosphoribosyltransferase [candidate division KSB1 bacterium]
MNDFDPQVIDFYQGCYVELLSAAAIQQRVKELADEISRDFQGRCPVLIGVLNGAFIFLSDLAKNLKINCEFDFIKISSYGNQKQSSGQIKLLKDIDCHLQDRDVLVVEDIVDSGHSLNYLTQKIGACQPRSIKFVSLLRKQGPAKIKYEIDYLGFWIPNEFVVGYGLDFAQKLRNLPAIYVLK